MSTAPPRPAWQEKPRLFDALKDDYHVVRRDVQRRGVWRTVGSTLSGLEGFYLTDAQRTQLASLGGLGRFFVRIWWLVEGLLMKLTPARRILLFVALLVLLTGLNRIEINGTYIGLRFPLLGTLLLFSVLMLELKDKLVARDELEAGRRVQLALLPGQVPSVPGWDVWLYTQPANDVGGDLVDHLQIDGARHFVALGDVAGKALPAALLSVKLQATLRALAPNFEALGDLGNAVNHILERDGLPTRFASLVYLLLTPDSGRIRVLNAGHMPPLIVRPSGIDTMPRGSMVLGIMPGATFSEQQVDLETGDTLVVYSDGVSEAMNEAGDFFGDERLHAIVRQTTGRPVAEVGRRVLDAVAAFVGEAVVSDDISLIVVRRR